MRYWAHVRFVVSHRGSYVMGWIDLRSCQSMIDAAQGFDLVAYGYEMATGFRAIIEIIRNEKPEAEMLDPNQLRKYIAEAAKECS